MAVIGAISGMVGKIKSGFIAVETIFKPRRKSRETSEMPTGDSQLYYCSRFGTNLFSITVELTDGYLTQ